MVKSEEFRGKTVDEAVANALAKLGLEREDVSVEILERGKNGFLGFGASDAVVSVSFEAPDEAPVSDPVPAPKAEPKPTPAKKEAPVKKDPPVKMEAAVKEEETVEVKQFRPEGTQAEQTEAFLAGLLAHMGVKADIDISPRKGGGLDVNLSGSGIGAVIGRRGETLDAIQHLTNYAVNSGGDKRSHINVDAEGYRAKREESLERLAQKMAAKAVKYKRSMALEPMNSYERHVIHAALQDYEGVTTSSTGSEPNRRVVVSYVPAEPKKPDSGYKEWC